MEDSTLKPKIEKSQNCDYCDGQGHTWNYVNHSDLEETYCLHCSGTGIKKQKK